MCNLIISRIKLRRNDRDTRKFNELCFQEYLWEAKEIAKEKQKNQSSSPELTSYDPSILDVNDQ
jgi:hypothetical protein